MFLPILLCALSSLKLVLSKKVLLYLPPIFFVGVRNATAGILLLAYHVTRGYSLHINKQHIVLFIKAIFFGVYVPYVLRFWGLQHVEAYKASLLLSLSPFISYIMSHFIAQEKWAWNKVGGLCIGFAGMLPILILQTPEEAKLTNFFFLSTAELAMFASTISLLYGWINIKKLTQTKLYSPVVISGINMMCGGLMAFGTSYMKETVVVEQQNILPLIGVLAFIILAGNVFTQTMYVHLLKKFNVTLLSFTKLLAPIFTAIYSWFLFGSVITWHFVLALICLSIGFTIFYREETKSIQNMLEI